MCFQFRSKNCDRASDTDEKGKSVPKFRAKVLNCLKTMYSSIFKGFKEITSGCLSGSNLVNSYVRAKIVVEGRRG